MIKAKAKDASCKKSISDKFKIALSNYQFYLMLLPGLIYLIIFKYVPMYGITIAFKDFNIFDGIQKSPWVGLANFQKLVTSPDFFVVFRNTLVISLSKIIVLFPLAIIVAIMINEIKVTAVKKTVQTMIYIPHFLSWVIVAGIFATILSPSSGVVNKIIISLGGSPIAFFMDKSWFRAIIVMTDGWKETGYSAIVYIAAIAGIDQELYEAADIDGAGRIKKILYITIPGLSSTIVLMFILRLGSILEAGTEQILMMYNPTVYEVGDVIGTYVYRMGLGKQEYSFSTAVGLFNSVVGLILVLSGNLLSKKLIDKSIW